jgi:hypothetical protein
MSSSSTAWKGCVVPPLGVVGGHRLHAVDGEEELEVGRLLGPEAAVVVEDGDALGGRDEVGRAGSVVVST